MGGFEDSLLSLFVDIISYHRIANPELKEHIGRVGKVIYERSVDEVG